MSTLDGVAAVRRQRPGGAARSRRSLASLLAEAGVASEEQLQLALAEGTSGGERLGEVVLRRGWLDEVGLARVLARQWELPFLGEEELKENVMVSERLPLEAARRLGACTLEADAGTLVIVAEPARERFRELTLLLGSDASFAVTTAAALAGLLAQLEARQTQGEAARAAAAASGVEHEQAEAIAADLEAASQALAALRARIEPLQSAHRQSEQALAATRRELAQERAARAEKQGAMRALQHALDEQRRVLETVKDKLAELTAALEG